MNGLPENFIMIGSVGVGKTTLFNLLLNRNEEEHRTQALVFHDERTIDTPGEYFDNPRLYTALISTMTGVDTVLYLHQSNSLDRKLPHGLFRIYDGKRVIGVISKTDLPDAQIQDVREILHDYGIDEIYEVSIQRPETVEALRKAMARGNIEQRTSDAE